MADSPNEIPRGNARGFTKYLQYDIVSGLLVFLIALPLCLGISLASGYPPLAGIFTAIIGSILTSCISNSELTIKGPAAGLIVIVLGCISAFGGDGWLNGVSPDDIAAYRSALAVGCVAAVLQIFFGIFRAGILGEFFPVSAVHGMLAAIGVIIISKQIPFALGVTGPEAKGDPLELLARIPKLITLANPAIASIGISSLVILFAWPYIRNSNKFLKAVPGQLIVLIASIGMGMAFDLLHPHSYVLQNHEFQLGEQYLVSMPDKAFGMFNEVTYPDFTALAKPVAWWWVMMFFVIGSLESILSAKAVDIIDPWKRKTNMDRDILAVGVANLAASMVGGLPMISEIVRSKANIDNGARTRFADMWHGLFLLVCVALIPTILHRIPLAALAAMLVYTGFRLAHPNEFVHVYKIGREQLVIFVSTLIAVLATDLLIGVAVGIAVKVVIHLMNGVPLKSLFKPYLEVEQLSEDSCLIRAHHSAVFSNWIPFRRQLENIGLVQKQNITLDLSHARLVDHSVMEKLHEMQRDFDQEGLTLEIVGLDTLQPLAGNKFSTRRGGLARMQRLTIVATEELEDTLTAAFVERGATGYTVMSCRGAGRTQSRTGEHWNRGEQIRLEVIVPIDTCEKLLSWLRVEMLPRQHVTVCVEVVNVIRRANFEPLPVDSKVLESAH